MTNWQNKIFGDMKTAEELKQMNEAELISYCLELQEKVKSSESSITSWIESYNSLLSRYTSFKDAVKSVCGLAE